MPIGSSTNGFRFGFQSVAGVLYVIEYNSAIETDAWSELERRFGTGGMETITDSAAGSMRFYRVRSLDDGSFAATETATRGMQSKTNATDPVWLEPQATDSR